MTPYYYYWIPFLHFKYTIIYYQFYPKCLHLLKNKSIVCLAFPLFISYHSICLNLFISLKLIAFMKMSLKIVFFNQLLLSMNKLKGQKSQEIRIECKLLNLVTTKMPWSDNFVYDWFMTRLTCYRVMQYLECCTDTLVSGSCAWELTRDRGRVGWHALYHFKSYPYTTSQTQISTKIM
jgi:hypothetical protein